MARARRLAAGRPRSLLGITGAPAAGKSTVARLLAQAVGPSAVVVGMDGFHLAQAELQRLGRSDRKGAPDTFDADGYVALLRRLRSSAATVYAPEFHRDIEEPVAGAIAVPPSVRLVITEGNYLLLDAEPWCNIGPLLDDAWFLDADEQERVEWLVARHELYGRSRGAAVARTLGSDQRNAELIAPTAARADLVVRGLELP